MKKILNVIATFYAEQFFLIQILLFALAVVPFILLGAGLRYYFIIMGGLDEMFIPNTFLYTFPPLILFALLIFSLYKSQD